MIEAVKSPIEECLQHLQPGHYQAIATAFAALVGLAALIVLKPRELANAELIKKRIAVFDRIAEPANDIFCFLMMRGDYQGLTPAKIIAHKRLLDKTMHTYGEIWSHSLRRKYFAFMMTCFQEFIGAGKPAHIRLNLQYYQSMSGSPIDLTWMTNVSAEADGKKPPESVVAAYQRLMAAFAREIGVSRWRNFFK